MSASIQMVDEALAQKISLPNLPLDLVEHPQADIHNVAK
jgi:hypothetical protein